MKKFLPILFLIIIYPAILSAQHEEITILTFYPAPYGFYDQMYANTYTDRNDTDYFLDLDGRSRIYRLNIGVPTNNTVEKAVLQIGETLASNSNNKASLYAKTINIGSITAENYAAIYGETNRGSSYGSAYGVYGYSHSDKAANRGVYGLGTGSSTYDYGVVGVGDDSGVVGGGAKVGIAGVFGKDTVYTLPDFNCALYGQGQDITVGGTTKKAHGIYSKTTGSRKYAGYFESTNSGKGV